MTKKWFLLFALLSAGEVLRAQDAGYGEGNGGFKKENVFMGGSISLGFGSGSFGIGANPEIGYSLTRWLDAGVVFNINYFTQTYYDYFGYGQDLKASSFNYGGGVLMRAYPLSFLFVQLQPEYNWISYSNKYSDLTDKSTVSAASLIGGIGYGQHVVGQGSFFFMIGMDLLTNKNSPYLDGYGNPYPIIRAGADFYLRPSRKPKPESRVL